MRAALWMSGSIVSFVAMGAAGRALRGQLDVAEIMFYRSVVGFAVVSALLFALGQLGGLTARRLPWHLARNSVHFLGQGLWFWALTVIPLAQVFAIEFTSPIWVMLLAALFLGERLTPLRMIAALLGFVGVLIVARPDMSNIEMGVIAAAISAVCFAVNVVMIKRFGAAESALAILWWQTVLQALFGLVLAIWDGVLTWPTAEVWPWLLLISFAALVGHYCLVRALSGAPASLVMPIDFMRLPLAVAIGAWFFSEPADLAVIVGAVVIFLGNWMNIRYGAK